MSGSLWSAVLPVKGGPAAKSRLGAGPSLAAAIAADSIDAVVACPRVARVVVVTADDATAGSARRSGAEVLAEPGGGGLNGAVRAGLGALDPDGPAAVLLADVPALRPGDLELALTLVERALIERALADGAAPGQVMVADAEGTGTVLLAGTAPGRLRPAFGPGSLAAHRALGATVLTPDLPRLRRDVDTAEDLLAALLLGCGPRTRQAARTLGGVQATVHRFDQTTGSGSLLTDQGLVLPFGPEAFHASRLRLLRAGQRVTVTLDASAGAQPVVLSLALGRVGAVAPTPHP